MTMVFIFILHSGSISHMCIFIEKSETQISCDRIFFFFSHDCKLKPYLWSRGKCCELLFVLFGIILYKIIIYLSICAIKMTTVFKLFCYCIVLRWRALALHFLPFCQQDLEYADSILSTRVIFLSPLHPHH